MGHSYSNPEFAQERQSEAIKRGLAIRKERMALADKIVMAIVDRISAEVIRPGPKPEERECYIMAKELRDTSKELAVMVADILKIEAEEG